MHKYVIEREIPGVGSRKAAELCEAARQSNEALSQVGPGIQWIQSFVTPDKLFCVYLADGEERIRQHARESGFPAHAIRRVSATIDPTTAERP